MAIAPLRELDDWKLKDESQDLRGRTLRAPDGTPLGKIHSMIVNTDSERVERIVLENGAEHRVADLSIDDASGEVFIGRETERRNRPATGRGPAGAPGPGGEESIRVPVIEEQVEIGKRSVTERGVRITSEVKEEPVDETVTLRKTEVDVDRRKADRPATEEDLRQAGKTVEAIETREEAIVRKNARVIEEIIVTRKVQEQEQKVHDTTRKTEVHVEDVDPGKLPGRKAS